MNKLTYQTTNFIFTPNRPVFPNRSQQTLNHQRFVTFHIAQFNVILLTPDMNPHKIVNVIRLQGNVVTISRVEVGSIF